MGYTHYWYRPFRMNKELFKAAMADFRKTMQWLPVLRGGDGTGSPLYTDCLLRFNGDRATGGDYETFNLSCLYDQRDLHPGDTLKFGFCKTAHRPYDMAVMVALIVFKHHFGTDFKVCSDGDLGCWLPAVEFVKERLGYTEQWDFDTDGCLVPAA